MCVCAQHVVVPYLCRLQRFFFSLSSESPWANSPEGSPLDGPKCQQSGLLNPPRAPHPAHPVASLLRRLLYSVYITPPGLTRPIQSPQRTSSILSHVVLPSISFCLLFPRFSFIEPCHKRAFQQLLWNLFLICAGLFIPFGVRHYSHVCVKGKEEVEGNWLNANEQSCYDTAALKPLEGLAGERRKWSQQSSSFRLIWVNDCLRSFSLGHYQKFYRLPSVVLFWGGYVMLHGNPSSIFLYLSAVPYSQTGSAQIICRRAWEVQWHHLHFQCQAKTSFAPTLFLANVKEIKFFRMLQKGRKHSVFIKEQNGSILKLKAGACVYIEMKVTSDYVTSHQHTLIQSLSPADYRTPVNHGVNPS